MQHCLACLLFIIATLTFFLSSRNFCTLAHRHIFNASPVGCGTVAIHVGNVGGRGFIACRFSISIATYSLKMIGSSNQGDHENVDTQPAILQHNMKAIDSFVLDYLDGGISAKEFRELALKTLPDDGSNVDREEGDPGSVAHKDEILASEKKKPIGGPPKPEVDTPLASVVKEEEQRIEPNFEAAKNKTVRWSKEKREGAHALPSDLDELVQLHFAAIARASGAKESSTADIDIDMDLLRQNIGRIYADDDACSLGTFNSSSAASNISENSGSALSMQRKRYDDKNAEEKLPSWLDMIPLKYFFDTLISDVLAAAKDEEREEREEHEADEESIDERDGGKSVPKFISNKREFGDNKKRVDAELQSLIEKFRDGSESGYEEIRVLMEKYRSL